MTHLRGKNWFRNYQKNMDVLATNLTPRSLARLVVDSGVLVARLQRTIRRYRLKSAMLHRENKELRKLLRQNNI